MKRYIHSSHDSERIFKYEIWQISHTRDVDYAFMRWSYAEDNGFDFDDYSFVYEGEIEGDSVEWALEKLFTKFNLHHPADFRGHSLSVSDIIKLDDKFYYCDSFGFEDITDVIR